MLCTIFPALVVITSVSHVLIVPHRITRTRVSMCPGTHNVKEFIHTVFNVFMTCYVADNVINMVLFQINLSMTI